MEKDYYIKKIEELNLEIIELKSSKEYQLGKKYIKVISLLKKMKIIQFMKEFINKFSNKNKMKEIEKYNVHKELENDFNYSKNLKELPKIVVYTCITGKYDKMITPFLQPDNVEYVAFTDEKNIEDKVWKIKSIPDNIKELNNNILINRYIKFHPAELFANEFDYAIYIDGNISVVSDLTELVYAINDKTGLAFHRHQFRNCIYNEIEVCRIVKKGDYTKMKQQTEKYREEGFPANFGLYEANVIASDLKNKNSINLLNCWWDEFNNSGSFRDQIALPYVVWKNKYEFDDVGSLGNNVYKNPKIRIEKHK